MPQYISPGVYSYIIDQSQYVAPVSTTSFGLVGAASKGPVLGKVNPFTQRINTPMLITTQQQYVQNFGNPNPNFQGPYAAMLYLLTGNLLWYGRVCGSGAAIANKVFDGKLTISALNEGAWGNNIAITITDSFQTGAKHIIVYNQVGANLIAVENYDGLVSDPNSTSFYETIINPVSQYIHVEYLDTATQQPANTVGDNASVGPWEYLGSPASVTAHIGVAGNDGLPPSDFDIIGAVYGGYSTGLWAYADTTTIDVAMLAAPGYTSPAVVSTLETIVNARQDCMALLHGPQGLNAQDIVSWHNASGPFIPGGSTPSVLVNSNSCALYWPWVQILDNYNKLNVWVPPVGFAAQIFAYNDFVGQEWYAPAGINRAKLSQALALEYQPTQGDRDFIYGPGNGNAVNPLVNLPLDGITIYGQRTMQRNPSALDRINVRRLMFFLQKTITRAARFLVFEQDDPILWSQFKNLVAPFLQNVEALRGLEDFNVICDATTNTPFNRNNNQMVGYIYVIPVKSAEKIIIPFVVEPSGVSLQSPTIG